MLRQSGERRHGRSANLSELRITEAAEAPDRSTDFGARRPRFTPVRAAHTLMVRGRRAPA